MILFHFEPNQNPRLFMLPSINIWTSKPLSITYSLKVFCTVGVSYRIQRSTRAMWPRRPHVSKNVSTANSIPCPPPPSPYVRVFVPSITFAPIPYFYKLSFCTCFAFIPVQCLHLCFFLFRRLCLGVFVYTVNVLPVIVYLLIIFQNVL